MVQSSILSKTWILIKVLELSYGQSDVTDTTSICPPPQLDEAFRPAVLANHAFLNDVRPCSRRAARSACASGAPGWQLFCCGWRPLPRWDCRLSPRRRWWSRFGGRRFVIGLFVIGAVLLLVVTNRTYTSAQWPGLAASSLPFCSRRAWSGLTTFKASGNQSLPSAFAGRFLDG